MEGTTSNGGVNAEEAAKASAAAALPTLLPAAIWAAVLSEFCTYKDLRSGMASCSFLYREVPPLVKTLRVFDGRELGARAGEYAARKFPNVENVSVLSLTAYLPEDGDDDDDGGGGGGDMQEADDPEGLPMTLCLDTARDVVSFLGRFPRLSVAFVGGYTDRPEHGSSRFLVYSRSQCTTDGHQAAIRGMLRDFCDAFERGALDVGRLRLAGVLPSNPYNTQLDCGYGDRCQLCRRICETFPLDFVAAMRGCEICMPDRERYLSVYRRDGDILRNSNVLLRTLSRHSLVSIFLSRPMRQRGGVLTIGPDMVFAIQFPDSVLERIAFFCNECGCDASILSPEDTLQSFRVISLTEEQEGQHFLSRDAFDRLTRMGFPLRESDFNIIVRGRQSSDRRDQSDDYWVLESDSNDQKRNR